MPENKQPTSAPTEAASQDPVLAALSQADFSKASGSRAALRARLLQKAGRTSTGRGLRLTLEIGGLAVLALVFLFAVTRLANNQSPAPAATLPAPQPTPTLPPTPTSQPLTQTPSLELNLNSSPDTVRLAISDPTWKTLWLEAEIDYAPFSADNNQPDKRLFTQAWLEKGGRGLALSTDFLSIPYNFNLDFGVNSVTLFDLKNLIQYNMSTKQTSTTPASSGTQTLSPLSGSSPALDLVYPGFLAMLSSEPKLVRMEALLSRQTLVADWGNSRLWVDSQTGLLLKVERYTGEVGNSPLESILFMRQVQIDPQLDDSVFTPQYLNELRFQPAPSLTATGPTPTPFSQTSPEGWVYFQAAAQAPFEWKVYKLPAGCLIAGTSCPEPQALPGNPNLQITGFYWAPDGSLAIFSDTNNNQIVGFDPQTRQWPRLLQGFFQPQLEWSPDGKQIAALTEGVDAYDMRLVVIQRDGWTVHDVPTTLKGEKFVYGWLDNHTLALKIPDIVAKGTPPAWLATDLHPGIYKVDVNTGKADLLPLDAVQPLEASLSPDGKQFVYYKWVNNKASIFVASVDGTNTRSTGYEGNLPTWSPDGQWIQFQTYITAEPNQQGVTTQYVMHPDGSGLRKVAQTNGGLYTAWNPDSTRLLAYEYNSEVNLAAPVLTVFDPMSGKSTRTILSGSFSILDLLGWQP